MHTTHLLVGFFHRILLYESKLRISGIQGLFKNLDVQLLVYAQLSISTCTSVSSCLNQPVLHSSFVCITLQSGTVRHYF